MKTKDIVRAIAAVAVVGGLLSAVLLFRQEMLARFALEDAQRHHDSLWTEYPHEWKYTHVDVPEQQSYNARICAYEQLREDDGTPASLDAALLRVNRYEDSAKQPSVSITLCYDSVASRNVWLQWDGGAPHATVLQLTANPIDHTCDLTTFILDPYRSVLDSILRHDSLTVRVLTRQNGKVALRFKLPPLDTVMRKNPKLITFDGREAP